MMTGREGIDSHPRHLYAGKELFLRTKCRAKVHFLCAGQVDR